MSAVEPTGDRDVVGSDHGRLVEKGGEIGAERKALGGRYLGKPVARRRGCGCWRRT
ncbi:hypothetical protein [Streptomyces sp. SYSU K217416]